jgi:hypothetical protein
MGAGDYFNECGFASAVFTKERVDFTWMEIEGDAFESADCAEGFRDLGKLQKGVQSFLSSANYAN